MTLQLNISAILGTVLLLYLVALSETSRLSQTKGDYESREVRSLKRTGCRRSECIHNKKLSYYAQDSNNYKPPISDPFIVSPVINGKVFLFPGDQDKRKGDYFQNVVYCRNHNAEMISIQSLEENTFFYNWISKIGQSFGQIHPGVWLGAEIANQNKSIVWANGDPTNFVYLDSDEPNYPLYSCLANGYLHKAHWYDNPCTDRNFFMGCQRKV